MTEPAHLAELRAVLPEAIVAPGTAAYDVRRHGWDRRVDHRPAAVVLARCAGDVAAAVELAGRHQLDVVVQATGHRPVLRAGEHALLIDVSGLDAVHLDQRRGTVTVGGGTRWDAVHEAGARAGRAAVAPAHGRVGVAGSVLVGGLGWLARSHGMSRDHVVGAELVLPGGDIVRVALDDHADVLWALRGGGAPAPGVITALTITLVRQPAVYAGELRYPAELAPEVLARYGERIAGAPPTLTSSVVLDAGPPAWVAVRACDAGPVAEGRAWLDDWRRWAEVIDDRFTIRSASALGGLDDDPVVPITNSGGFVSTTAWLRRLDDDVIASLVRALLAPGALAQRVDIRHVGGAVRPGFGPDPHDSSHLLLRLTALPPTLAATPYAQRQLADLRAEMVEAGAITTGSYAGFTVHPADTVRTAVAFNG